MGLAASQARFLQLTARRSNIEFMGQQINQQRLALANESAGLFQRQLNLTVPTPPSSSDDKYQTPAYQYTDPKDGIKKNIKFEFNDDMDAINGYTITYNKYDPEGHSITITQKDTDTPPAFTITAMTVNATTGDITTGSAMTDGDWYIGFANGGTSYIDENTGRVTNIIVATPSGNTVSADMLKSSVVALTYSAVFDEKAYTDDMNKYEYEKSVYDYEIERINTRTSEIQQKDKSLELKMKQLDTEHNAIQTEMDAVQKVIQTNVSGSFKTFSS